MQAKLAVAKIFKLEHLKSSVATWNCFGSYVSVDTCLYY